MQIVKNTTILFDPKYIITLDFDNSIQTKKRTSLCDLSAHCVGVDGFEPPTLCL